MESNDMIQASLENLSRKRPIFHSEADFQHALAWEIQKNMPEAEIRLELPIRLTSGTYHVDVWIKNEGIGIVIELKYKTRALECNVNNEYFAIASHGAQDLGRYDVIKDIERVERIVDQLPDTIGYMIFLTNDSAYWARSQVNTIYNSFTLDQERTLHGSLGWGKGASEGTTKNRERNLEINGSYPIHWQNYSNIGNQRYGTFRLLFVPIGGLNSGQTVGLILSPQLNNIEKSELMGYYIYENWQAGGHKARIHYADCSFCNNGQGTHPGASEENGRWIGPFETFSDAHVNAVETGGLVSNCRHCSPK